MDKKNVLIVYYSLQGHTKEISKTIQETMGGDIFEIEIEKPYNLATAATIGFMHAKKGHTPELKNHVINIENYEVIFVGTPIWWYTVVPPVISFLKEYDLENKIVIPFCTHSGDPGDFFDKFANYCPHSKVIKGMDFHSSKVKDKNIIKSEILKCIETSLQG